jgi:hypothetical protein
MESTSCNPSDEKWPSTFQETFCQRYRCSADQYVTKAFRRCLFIHALPLASLIQRVDPSFFSEDYDLIREVGPMTDPDLFRNEINYFYGRNLRAQELDPKRLAHAHFGQSSDPAQETPLFLSRGRPEQQAYARRPLVQTFPCTQPGGR